MANTPTMSNTDGAVKLIRDDHRHILALFQLYRAAPADSRQSHIDQILQRLTGHFQMEERLTEDVRHQDNEGRTLVEHLLLEHEEIKAMVDELQQAENDDDELLDEFFEDMMQTVRAHFIAEERDLFPLLNKR
ncbi:MAG: hemerythrin domain-containing protein [Nitrospira sp.]|nr:hemerythrin domain-containing protein [Nitrospira sp.]